MSTGMIFIPIALFAVAGAIVAVTRSRSKSISPDVLNSTMKEFAKEDLTEAQLQGLNFIDLHVDAINAEHQWVCAYNNQGMFLLPAIINPYNRTVKKYEDVNPLSNWQKRLSDKILKTDKTEELFYIPFSSVSDVRVDRDKNRFELQIGDEAFGCRFNEKDGFWAMRTEGLNQFLQTLEQIK